MERWDMMKTLELVQRVQKGDRPAQEVLFQRYLPRVRQIVAVRAGVRLKQLDDVEDLVQESLLKVFQGIPRIEKESEAAFRNWVAQCIECEVVDRVRHLKAIKRGAGKVRRFADCGTDTLHSSIFAGRGPSPSRLAEGKEMEERIEEALQALPPHYRELIVLRSLCGMSYEEVARRMGFEEEATARKAFSRALEKLRAELKPVSKR